jgi:hypothetical protein
MSDDLREAIEALKSELESASMICNEEGCPREDRADRKILVVIIDKIDAILAAHPAPVADAESLWEAAEAVLAVLGVGIAPGMHHMATLEGRIAWFDRMVPVRERLRVALSRSPSPVANAAPLRKALHEISKRLHHSGLKDMSPLSVNEFLDSLMRIADAAIESDPLADDPSEIAARRRIEEPDRGKGITLRERILDAIGNCDDEVVLRLRVERAEREKQTAIDLFHHEQDENAALREKLADYVAYYEAVKAYWQPDKEADETWGIIARIEERRRLDPEAIK